ncbi:MAG: efflux RND transporter periplasmic adaptor subunit [Planctomycetes bacterium]|nr:efflux RND transporter periplasmic adaptor subunit [Planctomycetota bacterium]
MSPNRDQSRKRRSPAFSLLRAAALAGFALSLAGCGNDPQDDGSKDDPVPPVGSLYVPQVTTVIVTSGKFDEYIDLPGASVRGMETTPLHAKVGGFVQTIRRIGHVEYEEQGSRLQITDELDPETGLGRDIEFRLIELKSGRTLKREVYPDAQFANLKNSAWKAEYDKLIEKKAMLEIDVGSYVQAGTLIAVLDIPEMKDDLKKQEAVINSASSVVKQKQAAGEAAAALVELKKKERDAAFKTVDAARSKLDQVKAKHARIKKLGNAVNPEVLEEVEFEEKAADIARQSASKQAESAAEAVNVATANIKKANEDVNVAEYAKKEAAAELDRLKTLAEYAHIHAPFSGRITRRMVDHGTFVRPAKENSGAMPLFTITRTDIVRIVIPVPGRKSYKIKPGQTVWFHTIGGLPGVTIQGKITRSAATLDHASRMMRVEWYLSNPAVDTQFVRRGRKWGPRSNQPSQTSAAGQKRVRVRPGMFGAVTVHRRWNDLRKIPATALGSEAAQNYVMQVATGPEGKTIVLKRYVTVVYKDVETVGIIDGIPAGAKIVAENIASLKDGQVISLKSE